MRRGSLFLCQAQRVFRQTYINILSNVGLLALKLTVVFILTPVLVRNLGNHDYGIWEITASLVGYFGFLEVGLRPAVTRFAARYRSLKQPDELQALYANASFLLGVSGLIAFSSFIAWSIMGPDALAQPGEGPEKYRWFLSIIGLQLLIVMPSYVAESILEGFQKFHLKNLVTAINTIIGTSLVLALINPDNALLLVAGFNSAGISIKYLIYQTMVRRAGMGGIRWRTGLISKDKLRELVVFGGKSFIQGASGTLLSSFPNLIIGVTLGAAQVVFFALPRSLSRHVQNLVLHMTIVFMPMFAELTANGNVIRAREVFFPVTSLIVALSTLAALGISALGADFISVWVGPEYGERARTLVVLLAVHLWLWNVNPLDSKLLTAMNRHGIFARLYPIRAVVGIAACWLGSLFWGLEGVALGLVVAGFVTVLPVLRATVETLERDVFSYLKQVLLPCVAPAVACWLAHAWLASRVPTNSYLSIFSNAGLMTVVFAITFLIGTGPDVRRLAWRLTGARK